MTLDTAIFCSKKSKLNLIVGTPSKLNQVINKSLDSCLGAMIGNGGQLDPMGRVDIVKEVKVDEYRLLDNTIEVSRRDNSVSRMVGIDKPSEGVAGNDAYGTIDILVKITRMINT